MREFKFRIWAHHQKKFIYFNLESARNLSFPLEVWGVVQQFTGLFDKNQKEIFEGDIIQLDEIIGDVFYQNGAVNIRLEENQGRNHLGQERAKRFKVIGNIFENPELFEKKD